MGRCKVNCCPPTPPPPHTHIHCVRARAIALRGGQDTVDEGAKHDDSRNYVLAGDGGGGVGEFLTRGDMCDKSQEGEGMDGMRMAEDDDDDDDDDGDKIVVHFLACRHLKRRWKNFALLPIWKLFFVPSSTRKWVKNRELKKPCLV